MRSGEKDNKKQDKGSLRIMWITIGVANTLGVLFAIYSPYRISGSSFIQYIGLFLIFIGMIIRFVSVWSLGRLFTVDVTIRDNHTIKKDGMYSIIRHPSYLGSILSFIGFGLSLNNWISLIIITLLIILVMLFRIKIEENLLITQFGSDYSDYMKKTYRLVPWIY
jgi:protein-S-isoprenylcysteine O-methyltransferase Ste14